MKKFNWLMALLAFAAISFASCEPTPAPEPEPEPEPTPEELTFDVNVSSVEKSYVVATITPSDLNARYFVTVLDKATVEDFTKDEYLVGTINDDLANAAASEGKTFEEFMEAYLDQGVLTDVKFTGLAMNSDYYLLCWGVDTENGYELCSEVSKTPFKTLDLDPVDVTFEVTPSVYYNTVEFTVIPSDKSVRWHMMTLPKSAIDSYTDPAGEYKWSLSYFYQMYMQNTVQQYLGAGYTAEQIINAMFPMGDQTMKASGLEANTEYMYLIAGVLIEDGEIFIVTDPFSGTYTSGEALPSDMTFDISVTDVEQMRAAIKITPSNENETFFWIVEAWDGVSTAFELMNAQITQWGAWMGMMANYKGVQDYTGGPGSPYKFKLDSVDTDYYVLAFGYSGGVTTAPEMVTFRTLASDIGPYNVDFNVTVGGITPYGFTMAVVPNDDTVHYIIDAIDPSLWDEELFISETEAGIAYLYEQTLLFNPNTTMAALLSQYYWRGANNVEVKGMSPETEVMGYILALDYKTGKVSKVFTFNPLAKTTKVGDVQPTIELVGNFSGDDEAGAVFGQPDATAGRAICVCKYTGIENAKATYSATLGGDLSSETEYSDPAFMSEYSSYWGDPINAKQPYTFVVLDWQTAYTVGAYSLDANGVMGKPARLYVEATAENKGNIQDLIDLVAELNSQSTSALRSSVVYNDAPAAVKAGVAPKTVSAPVVAPVVENAVYENNMLPELPKNVLAPAFDYISRVRLHE